MSRKIKFLIFAIFLGFLFPVVNCNALTVGSTYRDMVPSNSITQNLVLLAENYDSFRDSKFVVFSDSTDSYYIVWSKDLVNSNNVISGSKVEYLRYYRNSSYNSYQYSYGIDSSFSLSSSYYNTSNIDGYGFRSSVAEELDFYYYFKMSMILLVGFVFIIAVTSMKRSVTV